MGISYSGVVLDSHSQALIDSAFPHISMTHGHHMTVTMGPLKHKKGKFDLTPLYPIGEEMELKIVATRRNAGGQVFCLVVELPEGYTTRNKFPHITYHIGEGFKPKHSNDCDDTWERKLSEPIYVKGVVTEVPCR